MSMAFELVVRVADGGVRSLQLDAIDANAARASAAREGWQVITCKARERGDARADVSARPARAGARQRIDVATFSHELASLLGAGLSVIEALRTLAANEPGLARRAALLAVVATVSEGQPLSAALQQTPGRFPALLIATISASEQTGDLPSALLRYAAHQQEIKALRSKVGGAAVYPALLLVVGTLVVLFLLGVVVPKFALLIESTRREMPWSTQLLMAWGRFIADHAAAAGLAALAALGGLLWSGRQVLRNGGRMRWVEALPLIGRALRQFSHAQLYRTTGMLVKGGIAVPRALQLSANLLSDEDGKRLARAVTLIHEGRGLSRALQEAHLADPVATSMLAVAERTGELGDMLERIAAFHESRLQRTVEMASRLFEPLLMIIIGAVVGGIVVLMYLPIFDLASSLQ